MNDPFLSDIPVPPLALPPAVPVARARVIAAAHDLLAVPDAALERAWPWRDSEADVRYGFYPAYETLEAAGAAVRRALDQAGPRRAPRGPWRGRPPAPPRGPVVPPPLPRRVGSFTPRCSPSTRRPSAPPPAV